MTKLRNYPFLLWIAVLIAIPTESEVSKEMTSANKEYTLESLRPTVTYSSENKKDPFQGPVKEIVTPVQSSAPTPLTAPESRPETLKPPELEVQGIIWGGRLNQAIINKSVVKVGDTIEGAQIIKIEKGGVVVSFGKKEFLLVSPAGGTSTPEGKP